MKPFDAIVLAGGRAERLGYDKAQLRIGGTTLLERSIAAAEDAERIVVVGPLRKVDAEVMWTSEDPPGGGPVAGLEAGLRHTGSSLIAVLACDLPLIGQGTVRELIGGCDGNDGCTLIDGSGRVQYLAAVYSRKALENRLRSHPVSGTSMRDLVRDMDLGVVLSDEGADVDTPEDATRFRLAASSGDAS